MESFTIFDDVFVPWERVFLCGEAEFAGEVANTFANVNRQGYLGADVGKLRLFIGAAQLAAELNGVTGAAAHQVEDRRDDPARAARSGRCGVTASHESRNEEGYQVPDPVLTNAGKHLAMEGHYMAARNLLEIAGGSVDHVALRRGHLPARAAAVRREVLPRRRRRRCDGAAAGDEADPRPRRVRVRRLLVHGDHPRLRLARGGEAPDVPRARPRLLRRARRATRCSGRAAVGEAPTVRVS